MCEAVDDSEVTMCNGLEEVVERQAQEIKSLQAELELVKSQVQHLKALVETSLPIPMAATQATKIAEQAVLDAAQSLKNAAISEKRIIIWGKFAKGSNPSQLAGVLARKLTSPQVPLPRKASWLTSKVSKRILGLLLEFDSTDPVSHLLAQRDTLIRSIEGVRGVSLDRPLHTRLSTRKPKSCISSEDPKLAAQPVVRLTRLEMQTAPQTSEAKPKSSSFTPVSASTPNTSMLDLSLSTPLNLGMVIPSALAVKAGRKGAKKGGKLPTFKSKGTGLLGHPPPPPLFPLSRPTLSLPPVVPPKAQRKAPRPKQSSSPIEMPRPPVHFQIPPLKPLPPDKSQGNAPWRKSKKEPVGNHTRPPPKPRHLTARIGSRAKVPPTTPNQLPQKHQGPPPLPPQHSLILSLFKFLVNGL